ncbi:MAG: hypothetical protein NTV34_06745 [Proteobacteria bacterium]|nr:hypothetical protein [Pseudomonadota bacterium]
MKRSTHARSLSLLLYIILTNLSTNAKSEEPAPYQGRSDLSESRREDTERRTRVLVNEHFPNAINAELGESERTLYSLPRSYRFQPCTFWRYDFNANGNVCTSTFSNIEVTDARDVKQMMQTISKLQTTITDLQNRITALENRP